ncbi:MAG: carbon-nitrogen hydrolase [Candidatus Kapabacteria bacterium]|nr:carbon-nitrogen hydrolase [Candidatus Kapabacteria bacterium]MDW7996931.1 nitrilase-related carbon-nitrogen hydrolase [Bacteroidota bacterium]
MASVRIAVVQFAPVFGDPQRNLATMLALLDAARAAHIVVFPELATTGYFFQSRHEVAAFAEPADGPTLKRLHREALWNGQVLIVGFPERANGQFFNAAAILAPDTEDIVVYRKTHLFYKEKLCFDPGDTGFFVVHLSTMDIRVGLMICYDWRFPEAARTLALQGADLIACPSNLVTEAWETVMPVRALENKVYLAVANRTGVEERGGEALYFRGKSTIYSYNGVALCQAGSEETTVLIAEVEPERTRNKAFDPLDDIFADRRPEHYRL